MRMIATVGTAYAVVVTAVSDPCAVEGLEWDRAVEFLPSIASNNLRAWLRAQEAAGTTLRHGVVVPASARARPAHRSPVREVCVPAVEYLLFMDALRAELRTRRAALAERRPSGSQQRADRRMTARLATDGVIDVEERLDEREFPTELDRIAALLTARR
ncbi:Uncharacterised protein [Nocardia otitidiscaviarum]|uniref:Uncharacterized protein n=2 Tax=Nocardia otitidiscaviarum TaxID=1823 RepID=A0A379JGZ0_9NOCA|nr:Uncharacterised protein [Nocardia otitidiscaviarum]